MLVGNQAIEDRQNLLAIGVYTLQVLAEADLEVVRLHPLFHHGPRHVNILPECFYIMPPEEEPIKEGSFPLGCQGVEFVSRRHRRLSENASIPVPPRSWQVLFCRLSGGYFN
jgi:hypothetical protein